MLEQERNPEVLASTPDEDLGLGSDCRGILRGLSHLAWRLDVPEAGMPGSLRSVSYLERDPKLLPQLEKNQEMLPTTQEEAVFR